MIALIAALAADALPPGGVPPLMPVYAISTDGQGVTVQLQPAGCNTLKSDFTVAVSKAVDRPTILFARRRAVGSLDACKALPRKAEKHSYVVEGVPDTLAVVLLRAPKPPRSVSLGTDALSNWEYSSAEKLLWLRFPNQAAPRQLRVSY